MRAGQHIFKLFWSAMFSAFFRVHNLNLRRMIMTLMSYYKNVKFAGTMLLEIAAKK